MGSANHQTSKPFRTFIVCALLACASGLWLNYYSSRVAALMQTEEKGSAAHVAVEMNHANLWMLLMLGFGFASIVFLLRSFAQKRRAIRPAPMIPIPAGKETATERYTRTVPSEQIAA